MDQTDDGTADVQPGFVIVRAHPNGDIPPEYLRAFQAVGRDGLVHLAYGSRATAHVFARHGEAEDTVRRLRRRTIVGSYDYLIQKAAAPVDVSSE
jgi:hypothetical protein